MQRPTSGESPNIPPLTPPGPAGYYVPGGFAAVPGQTLLPTAVTRAWPTLPELVNAMKRRMVLATFLGLLVGVAAAAAVWLAMPAGKHQVKALVQMRPYVSLLGTKGGGNDGDFESFKQNQVKLLRGRSLLQRVTTDPQVARLSMIQMSDDPIRMLEEQIRPKWESTELLEVSMQGDDPPQMKIVIDTLVAKFVEDSASDERVQRTARIASLGKAKEDFNKQLDLLEANFKAAAKAGISLSEGLNSSRYQTLSMESADLNRRLIDSSSLILGLEIKLKSEQKKLDEVKTLPVLDDDVLRVVRDDASVKKAMADKERFQFQLQQILKTHSDDNPLVVAKQAEVRQVDADLKAVVDRLRPAAELQFRAARERELRTEVAKQAEQLAFQKDLLGRLDAKRVENEKQLASLNQGALATLETDEYKAIKADRQQVLNHINQLQIAEQSTPRVTVREKADVVLNQNLKQKVLLAAAAALVGAVLIVLLVAFLEWRSRRVDSVDQVVNELGVRVIGTIPAFPSKASLKSGDAATNQNWRFVLNESVNSTRTMLLHAAKTQNMQVLMVTSAMQGEGKTSFASQLATSMATAGLRTLVLDTDLRNPSLHKLFDAPLTPGCSEVLCQEIDVSDAVQPTSIPNLWIIPAGQCSNRVISALAQGHPIESLLNRLRGQFDFIVVDSCPILPVADALLVGQHVDGVVLSVLQDISQLPKVQTASEKLNQLNIPLLGAVVNGIKPDVHAYGYNYVKQLPA